MIRLNNFVKEQSSYKKDLLSEIEAVIDSGWYILGDRVTKFENNFAVFNDAKYCIGVANGLEALQIALMACDIKEGDEVITTPLSAFATTLAIINSKAIPVFVDIDKDTLNINSSQIEERINSKTKAIMPVHLYGNPCEIKKIKNICSKHNLHLIEDACQAHGAQFDSKAIGTFGDIGCFSFYPTKNLGAIGDGGAIITNNENFARLSKSLRDYGQTEKYKHQYLGLNSRLDELQAAILSVKLKHLTANLKKRAAIAKNYRKNIRNSKIEFVRELDSANGANHLFVILTSNRDELKKYLLANNILSDIHYPIGIHCQPAFKNNNFSGIFLPVCAEMVHKVLSIPIHPSLEDNEIEYIVDTLNKF